MSATRMKALGRDHWERCWPDIKPVLGHRFIEEVDTSALDLLKTRRSTDWSKRYGPFLHLTSTSGQRLPIAKIGSSAGP